MNRTDYNPKTFARICAIAVVLTAAKPEVTQAQLYEDGYNDAQAQAIAAQYSNSLAGVTASYQGSGYFASGVFLNSDWILAAAHPYTDDSGNLAATMTGIVQGTSVYPRPLIPVLDTYVYPGYDGTQNTPDLILIYLGPNSGVIAPALTIGSATSEQVVTSAGVGYYGTVDGGLTNLDGNWRGWQATVFSQVFGSVNPAYYQSTDFGPYQSGVSLNGRAANGNSGGPVFNSEDQLVGINEAASSGLSPVGYSDFLNLSQSNVLSWIMNTVTPVAAQILSVTATNADVQLIWSGKGGSNYVVQACTALGGTNAFADISGVIALPGVGPVTTNFVDSGALTNYPARFYRVRSN